MRNLKMTEVRPGVLAFLTAAVALVLLFVWAPRKWAEAGAPSYAPARGVVVLGTTVGRQWVSPHVYQARPVRTDYLRLIEEAGLAVACAYGALLLSRRIADLKARRPELFISGRIAKTKRYAGWAGLHIAGILVGFSLGAAFAIDFARVENLMDLRHSIVFQSRMLGLLEQGQERVVGLALADASVRDTMWLISHTNEPGWDYFSREMREKCLSEIRAHSYEFPVDFSPYVTNLSYADSDVSRAALALLSRTATNAPRTSNEAK